MRYSWTQRVVARVVGAVVLVVFGFTTRYLRHCCRWHLRGPLDAALRRGDQVLIACWHQDVLPLFHYLTRYTKFEMSRRFVMLASRSFDGEITERIMAPWGFRFVRGSAGKPSGRGAARGLRRALERGASVIVVADGPRPPARRLRPGPVYLARTTRVPLYVARCWARPQLVLPRTWFRPVVPLPRAHLAFFSAGPLDVSGTFDDARGRAEAVLNELCDSADAHLYLPPAVGRDARLAPRV